MAKTRMVRGVAYAWVVVLALLVLGPALAPGFVLSYDLVFTPRQDLLPSSLGIGGGLPRAVPQDAVVAIVETLIPGMLVEKAVLIAIPVLAGWGMLRLLPGTVAGTIAATLAVVNPFVVERLVIGHWGLLLAYALVPWAVIVSARLRRDGDAWDGVRLLLLVAAAGITPSGSVLVALIALPIVILPGSALTPLRRAAMVAAGAATTLPWVLPALLHPLASGPDSTGAEVFALRSDGAWGPMITALGGAGIWNAEAVPVTRTTVLGLALTVLVLVLAAAGIRPLRATLGSTVAAWWAALAVVGLLAAVASALAVSPWSAALDAVPGAGLARDAHKLLAPWVLLASAAAGAGAGRLLGRITDRGARVTAAIGLVIVPLAFQPDALLGVSGRLTAVDYPGDWQAVREIVAVDPRPGDVVSLPWTSFRRFPWNGDRTVLDPAPRWLPRTTVVSDGLVVETAAGLVTVTGDDPRSRAVTVAMASGERLDVLLPRLGIGWVLVALDSAGPVPQLPGWDRVLEGDTLALYAAPGAVEAVVADGAELALVGGVDLALLVLALAGLGAIGIRRVRVRRASPLIP